MESDLRPCDGGGGDDLLGVGGYGAVRKMRWVIGGVDVAVKELLQRMLSPKATLELRHEAEAMHAMRHPNIIQLFGASLRPPHMCLVLEFATHGSLNDVLRHEGAPHAAAAATARTYSEVWVERYHLAADAARGLMYLHSRGVLHRDVKSANVLLFEDRHRRVAKLADFGLAVVKNESSTLATAGGSLRTLHSTDLESPPVSPRVLFLYHV